MVRRTARTGVQLEIREADFADAVHAQGIVDVLDSYATDPVGGGKPLGPDVRDRIVPALRSHPGALVLLAFAEARPVGVAICFRGLSTFQALPLLNVHDLAVLPALRGKGVGHALLSEVERRARRDHCCKLTLEVQEDNAPARSLYERFGFSDFRIGDSGPTRFLSKPLGAPPDADDSRGSIRPT